MNSRIIVIDDQESILDDYLMILTPPRTDSAKKKKKRELEELLFGKPMAAPVAIPDIDADHYEVETAIQGREGFEKVKKAREAGSPFALAFIDIRMPPGWDGIETSKRIREIDREIEIVIVTAYSDRDRREIIRKVGMPERLLYIKKPFDPDEIRQLALSLTRKWDLERKAVKHREYLERLLNSVRRLKTLNITSIREVLCAILSEVLSFVNAKKGFIARLDNGELLVEIASEDMTPGEIDDFKKKVTEQISSIETITWVGQVMVFPLKDSLGNLFILVTDVNSPVIDEKLDLLRLLIESSSEALESARKQERLVRNEKIATIGQIAAGIIHEINNPLTAIIGAADLFGIGHDKMWRFFDELMKVANHDDMPVELKARSDELRDRFQPESMRAKMTRHQSIIINGAERVSSLMSNIRNFSKYDDQFTPEISDIAEALDNTLTLAHNNIKYGITLHRDWDAPLMAKCDINSLRQVFLNLILNSVQAMGGTGTLRISGRKENGKIALVFRDDGPGIPKEKADRIFEAFYTTKDDGTGLGLSIVKGIIDRHGGEIRVESEPGMGTAFIVEIPVER